MKKGKLSIGLVTSFIGVLALTACGEVSESKNAIVTFKGYDGSTIKVLTNNAYENYQKSSTGISTYYNSILETVVRYQYQNPEFMSKVSGIKTYNEVVSLAENRVKADKATAESNATTNSTSYNEEWEKILKEKGCEDEAELKEYYIYTVEKEQLNDWIYDSNKDSLEREYIGVDKDYKEVTSKVSSQYPYHIRHILVEVSGSSTNYIQSTIAESEITRLYTVLNKLTDDTFGYLFADVAKAHSEDKESAKIGGDVGIVTPSTTFVNEFKLGLYAYDAVLSGVNTQDANNKAIYDGLGLNEIIANSSSDPAKTVKDSITSDYLDEVPYVVFEKLNEYAKVTTDDKGREVNDNEVVYYPRNIIFNQFLNLHNPFVITDDVVIAVPGAVEGDPGYWKSSLQATNSRFQTVGGKKVLCDELGRVIVGVRGEYGIHLMVMEKSIFSATNNLTGRTSEDNVKKYSTNLEQYYSTLIPTDTGFPTFTDSKGIEQKKVTYVNADEEKGSKETYSSRADTVKGAVKGFDSTYDYRLYETLISGLNVKYQGTLKEDIEAYISNQRASNKLSSKKSLNDSWRTYIELLEQQDVERANGALTNQLVPTTCAVSFSDSSKSTSTGDWAKGGQCHNAK